MPTAVVRYDVGAIDLGTGTILRSPDRFVEDPAIEMIRIKGAGRFVNSYSAVLRGNPTFRFVTPEIDQVLDTGAGAVTLAGREIVTPIIIYYTKRNPTAIAGVGHALTTINEGIIFPTLLSFDDNVWLLAVDIYAFSADGSILPFVFGTGSLPAFDIPFATYTGGKVTVNGLEVECWQRCSLTTNARARHIHHKGLHYPVRAEIMDRDPRFEITNLDPAERSFWGQYGTRIEDFELFLRANETTDGLEPSRADDGDGVHIRYDGIDGLIVPGETRASSEEGLEQDLALVFDENASTAEIVENYGVTIT
jgi:hypothetical protein